MIEQPNQWGSPLTHWFTENLKPVSLEEIAEAGLAHAYDDGDLEAIDILREELQSASEGLEKARAHDLLSWTDPAEEGDALYEDWASQECVTRSLPSGTEYCDTHNQEAHLCNLL